MWDAAMLMGTEETGIGADIITSLLLSVNVICQVIFMAILIKQFWNSEWSAEYVDNMKAWRSSTAQCSRLLDPMNPKSLAERVCDLDESIAIGSEKVNMMRDLKGYWNPVTTSTIFSGPSLALVCVLAWTNTVVGELNKMWRCFFLVIVSLPTDKPDKPWFPGETDITGNIYDGYQLSFASVWRKLWVAFLILCQLLVAVILLIVGCFFITNTASVEILLLHALAMELIFTIDERIFEALAPSGVANVVEYMKPLEAHIASWRGLDVKTAVLLPATLGWILLIYYVRLDGVLSTVKGVQSAICGGQTNFVYYQDLLGLLWVAPTVDEVRGASYALSSQLSAGTSILNTYPFQASDWSTLGAMTATSTSDQLQIWQNASVATPSPPAAWCGDIYLTEYDGGLLSDTVVSYGPRAPSNEALAHEGFESCEAAEAQGFCTTSSTIRAICSETCGCDRAKSKVLIAPAPQYAQKLLDAGIKDGCPAVACYQKGERYNNDVAAVQSCADFSSTTDVDAWAQWADQFGYAIIDAFQPTPGQSFPCKTSDECTTLFLSQRCNITSYWKNFYASTYPAMANLVDPCNGVWSDSAYTKPLNTFCPTTCNCAQSRALGCPQCPAAR